MECELTFNKQKRILGIYISLRTLYSVGFAIDDGETLNLIMSNPRCIHNITDNIDQKTISYSPEYSKSNFSEKITKYYSIFCPTETKTITIQTKMIKNPMSNHAFSIIV